MNIARNGSNVTGLKFSDYQLAAWALATSAYDGQIGTGQITIPGDLGWVAGDRISIIEQSGGGSNLLGFWYVGDRQRQRNQNAPLEVECIYNISDTNRQLIGREVVDWTWPSGHTVTELTQGFIANYCADLTVDDTTWVDIDSTQFEAQVFTGDGFVNPGAQVILYTGKTFYLVPGTSDNTFVMNFHALNTGPTCGLSISDTAYDGVTVFAPQNPVTSWTSADVALRIYGRNGAGTDVPVGTNTGALAAGGLHWDRVVTYGTDQTSLVTYVNTLHAAGSVEIATYACTIGPLTGAQIALLPPGGIISVTSTALGLSSSSQRIALRTLRVAQEGGVPAPGLWYADLELSTPLRQPSAATGYGGTGGAPGALAPVTPVVDHVGMTQADLSPDVGQTSVIDLWLADVNNNKVPINGVTIFIAIETDPPGGTDYTVAASSLTTDDTGTVSTTATHVSAGPSIRARVTGSL